jgi:hypothetical protein
MAKPTAAYRPRRLRLRDGRAVLFELLLQHTRRADGLGEDGLA